MKKLNESFIGLDIFDKIDKNDTEVSLPKAKKSRNTNTINIDDLPIADDIETQSVEDIINQIDIENKDTENTDDIETQSVEDIINQIDVENKDTENTDDIETQSVEDVEPNNIVVPESINSFSGNQDLINDLIAKSQESRRKKLIAKEKKLQELNVQNQNKTKKKKKNKDVIKVEDTKNLTTEEKIENAELVEIINETSKTEVPEDINAIEIKNQIEETIPNVPNSTNLELDDFDVKISEKKDKSGYRKTKVSLKKEGIPEIINIISSYVKKGTKGVISPRIMDFRVIGNTNKTQLKGSSLKLSSISIVYKPDSKVLKVNKGTRIAISVPENFNTSGNLLIYMQESRNKTIIEINRSQFETQELFNEFIGDGIVEYYVNGFDVSKERFTLRKTNNPLMQIMLLITKTSMYKVKPYINNIDDTIYSFDIKSKGTKNQWLKFNVIEGELPGIYKITLINNVMRSEIGEITSNTPITIEYLKKNILNILEKNYEKDWDFESNEEDRLYYLLDKLSYIKLKNALIELNEFSENETKNEIENNIPKVIDLKIGEVLSQKDTAKLINAGYGAESIVGKTNYLDYFIITYLAQQIIGGDKRKGQQYITTDKYYQKYSVKDKRNYQDRENTILKKEGVKRNYNSRPYMFQLEYSFKNKKCIYKSFDWEDIKETTKFLTENPIDASSKSKY